jgi:DNA-binding NtrC family response regulator
LALARSLAPEGDLVMELLRRQGECLDMEGRHEEAHRVLTSALELCHQVGDEHETAVTLRCMGINSSQLGCWTRSLLQLEQALTELKKLAAAHEAMIAGYHLARLLVKQLDTGNAPHSRKQVLDRAWEAALDAQQRNKNLDTSCLAEELKELVNELARRRLLNGAAPHRAPAPAAGRRLSDRVVAVSRSMQQLLRQCDGFATSDCAVLIQGEGGSGKELLARRIHESSPRANATLVRISCAASDEALLARQLFGQAEPRPDDPRRVAEGLVARAEGGTLLLSNIDEMPRPLQAEIVHLLNDATYRPLGDSREHEANVRIIATSSRELASLVRDNLFRPDLHFKLRLMAVQVPPLRSRPEDAMPLLDHFLTRLEGSPLTARELFDFSSLEEFATYDWPGGASELEAIAQRAWLNRNLGRPIVLRQIPGPSGQVLEFAEEDEQPNGATTGEAPIRHSSGMTWASLNSLISKAGGNKARAARNLGVSRITLYRWLKQLKPQD